MKFIDFNWWPILVPFFVGIFRFKSFSIPLKLIFLFVAYGTFNELLLEFLIRFDGLTVTGPFNHVYGFISFLILGFYFSIILKTVIREKVIYFMIILYEIFYLINSFFIQHLKDYPTIARTVGAVIYILFVLIYFYKVMREAKIQQLRKEPLIWINLAILIYFAGNFFFFILFSFILEYSKQYAKPVTVFFSAFNAILYILITIGFLNSKSGKKSSLELNS